MNSYNVENKSWFSTSCWEKFSIIWTLMSIVSKLISLQCIFCNFYKSELTPSHAKRFSWGPFLKMVFSLPWSQTRFFQHCKTLDLTGFLFIANIWVRKIESFIGRIRESFKNYRHEEFCAYLHFFPQKNKEKPWQWFQSKVYHRVNFRKLF